VDLEPPFEEKGGGREYAGDAGGESLVLLGGEGGDVRASFTTPQDVRRRSGGEDAGGCCRFLQPAQQPPGSPSGFVRACSRANLQSEKRRSAPHCRSIVEVVGGGQPASSAAALPYKTRQDGA
jgi:hypothetical protein